MWHITLLIQIAFKRGGMSDLQRGLRGWLFLQGYNYECRLLEVVEHHSVLPSLPAYAHTR